MGPQACFGERQHLVTWRISVLSAVHSAASLAVAGGSCPILHWAPRCYGKLQRTDLLKMKELEDSR